MRFENQTLLIDADDTLWENNIFFEQAIEAFIDFLDHSTMSKEQVRAVLDEIEMANAVVNGYGTKGFTRNLRQCYEHLAERHISDDDLATVLGFGNLILSQEIQLLEGVEETLGALAGRHQLVMFTKGSEEEQRLKIDRSGIDMHFVDAIVVPEKNAAAYRIALGVLGWNAGSTWMVGNSPKSDINPAIEVGLGAVFIPHAQTWSLEHQEVRAAGDRYLELTTFTELLHHF